MATDSLKSAKAAPPVAARVASAASVLFAVSLFLCVASVNVPHKASGPKLLDWWQDGTNQTTGIISMFFAIAAAVLFIVAVDYFRALVASTGDGSRHMTQFAHSMATAFSATLLVSAALRGVIGHQVKVDGEPLPGLDVLRYATALNYTLIGTVTMTVLALSMLAISNVVINTGVLARWVGILGVVCSLIIFAAIAVSMGAFAIPLALLWAIGLAVAIWQQPARR